MLFALIILAITKVSNAVPAKINIANSSYQLLKTLRWDDQYEEQRKKDINYLFGSIDGAQFQGLSALQKEQVLLSIRNAILKQLLLDKDAFKEELLNQYNQFFTADELLKLTMYFKTKVMQMLIQAKIEQKEVKIEEIVKEMSMAGVKDQQAFESYRGTYLEARYQRFQEKIDPMMKKLFVDRIKEISVIVLAQLPQLIKEVTNQVNIENKVGSS